MNLSTLALFTSASFLLVLTPGPDLVYVLTRGIGQGRRAAFAAACGFSVGVIVHTLFAIVGLSALIRSSALAFQIVKYIGAAYLIYLGIKALRSKEALHFSAQTKQVDMWSVFRQSIVANVLNPKVALFFLAFLPQFIDFQHGSVAIQMLVLGTIFMILTLVIFGCVGYFAGSVGKWLQKKPGLAARLNYITGSVFIALGIRVAWPEHS